MFWKCNRYYLHYHHKVALKEEALKLKVCLFVKFSHDIRFGFGVYGSHDTKEQKNFYFVLRYLYLKYAIKSKWECYHRSIICM